MAFYKEDKQFIKNHLMMAVSKLAKASSQTGVADATGHVLDAVKIVDGWDDENLQTKPEPKKRDKK